jgi:hypothetical protein
MERGIFSSDEIKVNLKGSTISSGGLQLQQLRPMHMLCIAVASDKKIPCQRT